MSLELEKNCFIYLDEPNVTIRNIQNDDVIYLEDKLNEAYLRIITPSGEICPKGKKNLKRLSRMLDELAHRTKYEIKDTWYSNVLAANVGKISTDLYFIQQTLSGLISRLGDEKSKK